MAKPTRAEKQITHVQIQTHGGNTLVPKGSFVWTLLGKKAAQKRAEDVIPGDKVLEINTSVSVSLDEIKSALLQDDLAYKIAHERLYIKPAGEEKHSTRLQEYLLSALEEKHGIAREELSGKEKLAEASELIENMLAKAERKGNALFGPEKTVKLSRSNATVRDWLAGKTVLPDDPYTLRLLAGLHPERFEQLFGKPRDLTADKRGETTEKHPLLWAHDQWAITHQVLMNWVSGFSQKALESGSEEIVIPGEEEEKIKAEQNAPSAAEKRRLDEQRRIVYDRLIKPIFEKVSKEHAFVRVKGLKPVSTAEAGREKQAGITQGPTLPKGVLVATKIDPKEELDIETTDFGSLYREHAILRHTLIKVLDQIPINVEGEAEQGFGMGLVTLLETRDELEKAKPEGRAMLVGAPHGAQRTRILTNERAKSILNGVLENLTGGTIDSLYDLPAGSLLKIFERGSRIRDRLPVAQRAREVNALKMQLQARQIRGGQLTSQEKRDFRAKVESMERNLVSYGIPPTGLILPEREGISTPAELRAKLDEFGKQLATEALRKNALPPQQDEVLEALENAGLAREEAERLLSAYGQRNFIRA